MVALPNLSTWYCQSDCFVLFLTATIFLFQFFLPIQFPQNTILNRLFPSQIPLPFTPQEPIVTLLIWPNHYHKSTRFSLALTVKILPSQFFLMRQFTQKAIFNRVFKSHIISPPSPYFSSQNKTVRPPSSFLIIFIINQRLLWNR